METRTTAKLLAREDFARAGRHSKKPVVEIIVGVVAGLAQEVFGAVTRHQGYDWPAGIKTAVLTAAVLWFVRFVWHLWMAPREIAMEDRQMAEQATTRVAELEATLSRQQNETYTLMVRVQNEIRLLRGLNILNEPDSVVQAWEAQYDALLHMMWQDLRPRVKEHEFLLLLHTEPDQGMSHSRDAPMAWTKYMVLSGLSHRIAQLMERYQ
jgi:hypothetical protein